MKLISKAIIKVTQSVKTLEKNATVGFGRNSYDGTKMFDVMIAFNQIMSDNGLSILTTDVQDDVRVERWEENGRTRQSIFCSVKVRYLLLSVICNEKSRAIIPVNTIILAALIINILLLMV